MPSIGLWRLMRRACGRYARFLNRRWDQFSLRPLYTHRIALFESVRLTLIRPHREYILRACEAPLFLACERRDRTTPTQRLALTPSCPCSIRSSVYRIWNLEGGMRTLVEAPRDGPSLKNDIGILWNRTKHSIQEKSRNPITASSRQFALELCARPCVDRAGHNNKTSAKRGDGPCLHNRGLKRTS
jgi:hypothetical protein